MISWAITVFALAALMVAAGALGGWLLRARFLGRPCNCDRDRADVASWRQLASCLAGDMDEHSNRLRQIHHALTTTENREAGPVIAAVSKLLEANAQMQNQLVVAEQRLHEQAQITAVHAVAARVDALTQLANRMAFDDEIFRQLAEFNRRGAVFTLLMIDVDRFKSANDKLGHQAGDDLLRRLAAILRGRVREADMAARYGGDEFAVILSGASAAAARNVAASLCALVRRTRFPADGDDLHATISIGLSQVRIGDATHTLIQRADAALYAAKERGRNCACWHDGQAILAIDLNPVDFTSAARKDSPSNDIPAPLGEISDTVKPAGYSLAGAGSAQAATARDLIASAAAPCVRNTFSLALGHRLAESTRRGDPLCVVLARIDDCQGLRDQHGLQAGNQVFDAAGKFFIASVRGMDWVARFDMTTFAFLLPNTTHANAQRVAERLRTTLSCASLSMEGISIPLTVSLGTTEAMLGDNSEAVLRRAEDAMHASIRMGGNCIHCHTGGCLEAASVG